MTIPSVVLSNTFNEFRTITNQAIAQLNALESGTGSIVADNVNANLVNASVALRANNVTTLTGGTLVINTNGGVNTGSITVNSGLNGNIAITPNGTGNVVVTSLNATGNVNVTGTLGVTGATTFASSVTMSGGTANGVAYLNASKVLTTGSALTFDGTKLGVGTNAPQTVLDLAGASNVDQYWRTNAISLYAQVNNTNGTGLFGTITNHPLAIWANGSEQMRLTSTGLGIGTSSPAAKLDVASATFQAVRTFLPSITDTYHQYRGTPDGTGYEHARVYSGRDATQWTYGSYLAFYTEGKNSGATDTSVERMRIDPNGNLGLGVTPSAWGASWRALQVGGRQTQSTIGNASLWSHNSFNNGTNYIYIANDFATDYRQTVGTHAWYTSVSGTAGNAISFTQAMTLDASGNLGVGTTSTSGGRLWVDSGATSIVANFNSTAANGGYIRFQSSGTAYGDIGTAAEVVGGSASDFGVNARTSRNLIFGTNNSERARISATGNFGIGVTNPGYTLDVGGAIQANTFFRLDSSGTLVGAIGYATSLLGSGGNDWLFYNTQATNIRFYTNNLERLRLDSSGNLGLGVTPSAWTTYFVHQIGNSSLANYSLTQDLRLTSNAYYASGNWKYISSAFAGQYLIDGSTGKHQWFIAASGTAGANTTNSVNAAGSATMTLDASGNLGIGTTSPARRLDVNGGLRLASANAVEWGGTTAYITGESSSNTLFFATSGSEKMRLDSSGNLGIGNSSPTLLFQVGARGGMGSDGVFYWGSALTGNNRGILSWNTDIATIGTPQNLVFCTNSVTTERMRLDASGNLGIGTNSPIQKLDVRSGYIVSGTASSTSGSKILGGFYSSGHLATFGSEYSNGGPVIGYGVWPSTAAAAAFVSSTTVNVARGAYTIVGNQHLWYSGDAQTVAIDSAATTSERMRLDASGNLAIGTSSPTQKLDVSGAIKATGQSAAASANSAVMDYVAGTTTRLISYGPNTTTPGAIQFVGLSSNASAGDIRATIDSSGNLGLGVTPSVNDYTGAAQFKWIGHSITPRAVDNLALTMNAYHTGGGWKYGNTGIASAYIQGGGSHAWVIAPSGTADNAITFTQAMTLNENGRLLVGLTSDSSYGPLQVNAAANRFFEVGGSGSTRLRLASVDAGWQMGYRFAQNNGTEIAAIVSGGTATAGNAVTDSYIGFINQGSERVRITNTGNLGVGDLSPVEKLTVAGTIQASEGLKLNSGNTYTDVISFTTSSTSQVTLQSVTAGTYRSGKYFVQITSGTSYQVLELTLLHDGANVYMSQYGEIATGSNLGTFDANIDAGNMNLLFTPTNAVTKVRLTSTLVKQY